MQVRLRVGGVPGCGTDNDRDEGSFSRPRVTEGLRKDTVMGGGWNSGSMIISCRENMLLCVNSQEKCLKNLTVVPCVFENWGRTDKLMRWPMVRSVPSAPVVSEIVAKQ